MKINVTIKFFDTYMIKILDFSIFGKP